MRCHPFTAVCSVFFACLVVASTISLAIAQSDDNPFRKAAGEGNNQRARAASEQDSTPLTEQQRQLTAQLQLLKRSEAKMGAKHPAMQGVREEIAKITEQLESLAASAPQAENQPDSTKTLSIAELNDEQLRQLIERMVRKIEQLEKRVETLERQAIY